MSESSDQINQHMLFAQNLRASHKILSHIEKSKANTESMVDNLPDIYFVITEKGRILKGNHTAAKLFHTQIDGIINKSIDILFAQESKNIFYNNIKRLVNTYKKMERSKSETPSACVSFELGIDGKNFPKKSIHWNIRSFEGVSLRRGALISAFGRDITDIRKYEQQLSEIFSAIPLGIMMINSKGDIDGPYSAYLEFLLGYDSLKNKNIYNILFDQAKKFMSSSEVVGYHELQKVFGADKIFYEVDKKRFPAELCYILPSGTRRWIGVTYHPIMQNGAIHKLLLVFDDRTDLVKSRNERTDVDNKKHNLNRSIVRRR